MRADNLVVNGNFGTGDFTGWTQTTATNDTSNLAMGGVSGANYASFGAYTGDASGAFNGTQGDLTYYDGISQTLSTTAGASYTLTFSLMNEDIVLPPPPCSGDGCGPPADFVHANGLTQGPANYDFLIFWNGLDTPLDEITPGNGAFTQYTYTVTGTGSDQLSFYGYNNPSAFDLTDVSVSADADSPEPSSFLFLGIRVDWHCRDAASALRLTSLFCVHNN